MTRRHAEPLVLIDRDGTLIEEMDYLRDPEKVRLLPGVVVALKKLHAAGYKSVVISNQSGVGRGIIRRSEAEEVRRGFLRELKARGTKLDGYYWCPHRPSDRCACRKPKLGLVKRAARDLKTPWRHSISVGDRPSDIELGQKTGGCGILVRTGYGSKWAGKKSVARPDYIAKDFKQAVEWILKKGRLRS